MVAECSLLALIFWAESMVVLTISQTCLGFRLDILNTIASTYAIDKPSWPYATTAQPLSTFAGILDRPCAMPCALGSSALQSVK